MNIGAHKNEVNQLCAFLVELLSAIKSYSCQCFAIVDGA